jgi:uncharacterized protein (DUF1697 family)
MAARGGTTAYVALLRAVNVAGANPLKMAELRAVCVSLGYADAQTLLQSGNLVFTTAPRATAALESELESATFDRLGLRTDYIVRTAAEWHALIADNPFPTEAADDPGHLVAIPIKRASQAADVATFCDGWLGPERIAVKNKQIYVYYPDGIGRSKLTLARIEKALGVRGTGRNWNTVLKLAELCGEVRKPL